MKESIPIIIILLLLLLLVLSFCDADAGKFLKQEGPGAPLPPSKMNCFFFALQEPPIR